MIGQHCARQLIQMPRARTGFLARDALEVFRKEFCSLAGPYWTTGLQQAEMEGIFSGDLDG
jgi:hypothetical protein